MCLAAIVKIKIMSEMQPARTPPTYKTFVICVSRFYFQSKRGKVRQSMLISLPHGQTETETEKTCPAKSAVLLSSLLHLGGAPFSFPPFILRRFASYFY